MTQGLSHGIKVGDIFYTSWGYEQTNTEFYQVTRATEASVWLRRVVEDREDLHFMTATKTPRIGEFDGEEFRRKIRRGREPGCHVVSISAVALGYQWDGEPQWVSSYA
jgi:hypothetical protein